ncbi:hypothetical protein SLS58_003326 [Diplodia intermedia]|uniref:Uncharacterized protein n=1 Tax=Diplodia intermedia TaxID=856260 RepID=A0ABR3TWT3_9PEZI
MDFTRLRLSGSPATSPRIVDAPSSPTKSVYLDMDEASPTSPQMSPSNPYRDDDSMNNSNTITQATPTRPVRGTATATARRTNFFDPDSSDDELEEELTTADELAFSQRHSPASSVAIEGNKDDDEYASRGRSLNRYSPATPLSPTTTNTTTTHGATAANGDIYHRKNTFYLGVRPEEYAFVCGTRPASSTVPDDDDYYHTDSRRPASPPPLPPQNPGRGMFLDDGYSKYDVAGVAAAAEAPQAQQQQRQRQTLRVEGVSPKHVPFGAPDLAVAARRVLSERGKKKTVRERGRFVKVKASSSVLPYSASEYEEGSMVEGYGGNGISKHGAASYGLGVSGTARGDDASPQLRGGKDVIVERVVDGFEKAGDDEVAETQSLQEKTDNNILGVHAITLQALLRNEEGLQASASSVRRRSASSEFNRREFLKLQSKSQQPHDSATSLPPPVPEIPPMAQIQQPKRVSLVPPPIDTSRSLKAKSEGKVKTPPRYLASQGLKDTFSEENLLAHFRKPRLGRSRFAWVLWASRLAGLHEQQQPDLFSNWRGAAQRRQQKEAPSSWRDRELPPTPAGAAAAGHTPSTASTAFAAASSDDDNAKDDIFFVQAELGMTGAGGGGIEPGHSIATLEFVEGWSVARILTAVLLVLLLAAAGIVLWTLFGTGALVDGFRGSGARVGTAVLIGAGVLFFGWTLVLAWMGVSWCVV